MVYAGGAAGGATVAMIVAQHNAIKAMGSFIVVEVNHFLSVLEKEENPVVVYCEAGFFTKHKYLTSYKGLTFFTKSNFMKGEKYESFNFTSTGNELSYL